MIFPTMWDVRPAKAQASQLMKSLYISHRHSSFAALTRKVAIVGSDRFVDKQPCWIYAHARLKYEHYHMDRLTHIVYQQCQ